MKGVLATMPLSDAMAIFMPKIFHVGRSQIIVAVIAFVLFTLAHSVVEHIHLTKYYAFGVSLIYIPAGVKLLCILVGGVPALVGLIASSLFLTYQLWTADSTWHLLMFGIIGVLSYGVAVYGVSRVCKIKPDLSNLNYLHILLLSIAASCLNGIAQNIAYLANGVAPGEALLARIGAMAFGDFLGCFVVVMLFNIATHAFKVQPVERS